MTKKNAANIIKIEEETIKKVVFSGNKITDCGSMFQVYHIFLKNNQTDIFDYKIHSIGNQSYLIK